MALGEGLCLGGSWGERKGTPPRAVCKTGPEAQQCNKLLYIPGKSHALKLDINHGKLQLLFPQDFLNVFGSTHGALLSILLPWCFSVLTIHFREQARSQLK